jgi:peptide/nickel transport system ATP-binding protein
VEEAPVVELFRQPRHPCTQGLLGALPKLGSSLAGTQTRLAEIPGVVPDLKRGIAGCVFATRCAFATDLCRRVALEAKAKGHLAACHFASKAHGGGMSLLQVNDLKKHFRLRGGLAAAFGGAARSVHAVDGASFHIDKAETLALVGESGCGKSTVGRAILRLFHITSGEVALDGRRIDDMPSDALRPLRRRVQVVFQDPFSSLNPRMRVRDILAEPIRNFGLASSARDMDARIAKLMDQVRLPRDAIHRWPHEFSGGQRQRIGIARALAADPDLIVCDEAVSALDVSVKAQIVNLLQDLQRELGLALLFISHDLAIVEHLAHRVAVMYLGKIVELGHRRQIFAGPKHPYTEALLSAVPVPEPGAARKRIILKGDIPSPIHLPQGCRFHTRCPYAFERCRIDEPVLRPLEAGHLAACHLNDEPGRRVDGSSFVRA